MRRGLIVAGLLASTVLLATPAMAQHWQFEKVATIQMPGVTGHGDIVTLDPSVQMLYVAMHNDGLNVVDTRANSSATYIQNLPSLNGSDWDGDYVYVAAGDGTISGAANDTGWAPGKRNDIIVISKETWKEVGYVKTQGTSPDWLKVDRAAHRLYTDSDDNNWMEVYDTTDPKEPKFLAKWPLYPDDAETGPDVAVYVPSRHVIYQSDDSWVLMINTNTGAIERKVDTGVKLTSKGGTKGEIYDAKNHHVWVGTTGKTPGMFVLNADTLAVVKTIPQAGGADVVAFDAGLGLVYAFEGSAKGFDVYDANTMTHVAFVSTDIGQTHTGDVDPETHLVYAFAGDEAQIIVYKPVKK